MNINIAHTKEETVKKLANKMTKLINNHQQNVFNLAVSGGNTPALLFSHLANNYLNIINWQKVHFYWVDERCVPPDNNDSNYKLAYDNLLSKLNISTKQIHRIKGEANPDKEALHYAKLVWKNIEKNKITGLPAFDLILLGIGSDGHTASIFPDQMELLEVNRLYQVAIHPETQQKRITTTGKLINSATNISFLVTGKDKSTIIYKIISEKDNLYPASNISPIHGNIEWFLDEEASTRL